MKKLFDHLSCLGHIQATQRCLQIEYDTRRRDKKVTGDQRLPDAVTVLTFQTDIRTYGAAAAGQRRADQSVIRRWSIQHRDVGVCADLFSEDALCQFLLVVEFPGAVRSPRRRWHAAPRLLRGTASARCSAGERHAISRALSENAILARHEISDPAVLVHACREP